MTEARQEEREALEAFAAEHGRNWRETLNNVYWYNARIWSGGKPGMGSTLHGIRNERGPTWLFDVFKIPPRFRWTRSGSFVGKRVEIGAHLDMWMRGARFGVVEWQTTAHREGELMRVKVRMDHPQVRRLQVMQVSDLARIID